MSTSVDEMSSEQLEKLLQEKRSKERKERERERRIYETNRDALVESIHQVAIMFYQDLKAFKASLHEKMDEQEKKLNEYGAMNKNSKGGFSIQSSDGRIKVKRVRATEPVWDERSSKAIELIKDFLKDTVKKKDTKLYDILISFIAKNQNGDLEYNKVMNLLQHEDKYDDPRWVEGLRLIRESFSTHLKAYQYLVYEKGEDEKFHLIPLNFSAI